MRYYLIYSHHKTLVSLEHENCARLSEKLDLLRHCSQQTRDTVSNWSTTRIIIWLILSHRLLSQVRRTSMMEFWLISVPLDKISCQSLEKLKRVSAKSGLATSSRFYIPELKVRKLLLLRRLGSLEDLRCFTIGQFEAYSWKWLLKVNKQ